MSAAPPRAALRLVVILDAEAAGGRDPAALARAIARGGATMLQVRGKRLGALGLRDLARAVVESGVAVPVTVNDRLDVAIAAGAAGCHLGQDDLPLDVARRLVPAGFLLGGSAGSEAEAERCAAAGADYVGIGPVRATATKADAGEPLGPDGFRRVLAAARGVPAVAIGGVGVRDAASLLEAGAAGVAVSGAVLGADDPEAATRAIAEALRR